MRTIQIALALTLAAAAGRAAAFEWGHHQHSGPYLHFDVGGAGLESRANETLFMPKVKLSGGGVELAVSGGWSIVPNLQVGAELWEVVAVDPDIEIGGETTSTNDDSSFALVGMGPRFSYWIAPQSANVYVAATFPCFTRVSVDLNGHRGSTNGGLGGRVSVGKEWWMGQSQWGLGVAGHVVWSRNRDRGDGAPWWDTVGAGIGFSASWN